MRCPRQPDNLSNTGSLATTGGLVTLMLQLSQAAAGRNLSASRRGAIDPSAGRLESWRQSPRRYGPASGGPRTIGSPDDELNRSLARFLSFRHEKSPGGLRGAWMIAKLSDSSKELHLWCGRLTRATHSPHITSYFYCIAAVSREIPEW
jgi:hypothetical protein